MVQKELARRDVAYKEWKAGHLDVAEDTYRSINASIEDLNVRFELASLLAERGKKKEAYELMRQVFHPRPGAGTTLAKEPIALLTYARLAEANGETSEVAWSLKEVGAKDWFEANLKAAENARWRDDKDLEVDFYSKALELRSDGKKGTRSSDTGACSPRQDLTVTTLFSSRCTLEATWEQGPFGLC